MVSDPNMAAENCKNAEMGPVDIKIGARLGLGIVSD